MTTLTDILPEPGTGRRLDALLQLRAFITDEIAAERRRLLTSPEWKWIEAACDLYSIEATDVLGPQRDAKYVKARQIAAWLMREDGLSFPTIGRALKRDHTTAIHSVRAVEKQPALLALARQLYSQGVGQEVA